MVAVYGSIPKSGPSSLATTASQSRRRRAAIVVGLSAGAAAVLVICMAAMSSSSSASVLMGGGAEVYKDKWDELRGVEGGAWMQCMRCRHASKLCHPSRGERVGRVPFRTNACPPHAGMVTVSVKRHGKVALEWVDKEWLKRGQNTTKAGAEGGEEPSEKDKEEDKEDKEGGKDDDEGSVLCVKPPRDADAKHSWNASSDCMSVKEWIEKMDYSSGGYPYTPEEGEGGEGGGGGKNRRLLEEEGDKGEGADKEDDGEEKSPFQKWYDEKIDKIYEESYGSGDDGDGDGDADGGEEDKEDDEKDEEEEKPKKSPPRAQPLNPPSRCLLEFSA